MYSWIMELVPAGNETVQLDSSWRVGCIIEWKPPTSPLVWDFLVPTPGLPASCARLPRTAPKKWSLKEPASQGRGMDKDCPAVPAKRLDRHTATTTADSGTS
ncbi:hypothetical protein ISCGN_023713 [Ixodes scapularis]